MRNWNWFLITTIAMVTLLIIGVIAVFNYHHVQSEKCEASGGVWSTEAYVCFSSETAIPL